MQLAYIIGTLVIESRPRATVAGCGYVHVQLQRNFRLFYATSFAGDWIFVLSWSLEVCKWKSPLTPNNGGWNVSRSGSLDVWMNPFRYTTKASQSHCSSIPERERERTAQVDAECSAGNLNDEMADKPSTSD
ncbi:hypothetical protein L6452_26941 [Arctium lappa]|uniref:Uncharacterized protein n=1 Tax=Arctium lappa TaxID=4217 RepID=A0ACB8ZVL1_ARCLA|nr:hypothetical protein L6452_26941 [Arctium lappa]